MSEQSDYMYLTNLGATDSVLNSLAEELNDDFVVVDTPFAPIETDNAYSVTVPIEFGGNAISLTLRKDLSDDNWWLVEEGSVNGQKVAYTSRFTLDSFIHYHGVFTYIIVSPFKFTESTARSCIAHSSLLVKY